MKVWLVAVDGFSISGITKSDQIHELLQEKGYSPPKTPIDSMNLIYNYCKEIFEKNKNKIQKKLIKIVFR